MDPRFYRRVFTVVLAVATGSVAAQSSPTYNFAPVNQYGINLTAEYWNPILDYVSEKSGVRLNLRIARTSAETTTVLLAGEADFAFTNHLFTPERQALGWKVFGRRNTPAIHGTLVVPGNSPVTTLEQLADADVGFPGKEATVSYKFTYAHLLSRNIKVNPVFGGNTDGMLVQLFSGKVKAAGGNSQLIDGYAKREQKTYRVLWQSEPVYDLPLMVSSRVPAKEAKAVADAFFSMGTDAKGRDILRATAKLVKLPEEAYFIPATLAEYSAYVSFFKTAPNELR